MKRIIIPILCSSFFASLAVADDNDAAEVRDEYNACATLLSGDELSGEKKAKCKIYVRAYNGGYSNGFEKGQKDILIYRGGPISSYEEMDAGGFVGHTGNWDQVATTSNPEIGIGSIQIDPKALEAAKLKFEKLPSGDYALVSE